jgi:hypothetical protein
MYSTSWREMPPAEEAALIERLAGLVGGMQAETNAKWGLGRGLHRKAHAHLAAEVRVGELAEHLRHGMFAKPGLYAAQIRLSNGSGHVQKDKEPDIRGFALKVRGVSGPAALGGETSEQDFLLINHRAFSHKEAAPFVDLAVAATRGPLSLVWHLLKTKGFGAFSEIRRLQAIQGVAFAGYFDAAFCTVLPSRYGPYAARFRLVPAGAGGAGGSPPTYADEARERLATAGASWKLQAQFFVDEASTPIEDATVDWADSVAPWVDVAEVVVPAQKPDPDGFAAGEKLAFDPWNALEEHRPLGHIQRVRKAAYYVSQQARKTP